MDNRTSEGSQPPEGPIETGAFGRATRAIAADSPANRALATDDGLVLLAEQITRTRESLNDDNCDYCDKCKRSGLQPHHRAALLRALCELLDQQRIARGEPLPGSRRPEREPRERRSNAGAWLVDAQPAPVPAAQPAQVPDSRPLGWEYDEPAKPIPDSQPAK